ncbi:MAG TPA: tetratricopeptide repeat protein [Patescibacteria group bacterium]|nr:tetratricopeptide repeat protein [Patescibacteria group bacterium]
MIKKNPTSVQGRRLHRLAEDAREQGKFLEALELTDRATLEYAKNDDLLGLAEVQSSRQSTFKHLFRRTGKKVFLDLEKFAALSAVEIAQLSGINEALGIPYHNLGKYYFEVKDYGKAAEYFQKAIDNLKQFPSGRHSRA